MSGLIINPYSLSPSAPDLTEEFFGFPAGNTLVSFSGYATKGENFEAAADFQISKVHGRFNDAGIPVDAVVCTLTSNSANATVLSVLAKKSSTSVAGFLEVTLDTPVQINDGDWFFVGWTRTNGTGSTNNTLRYYSGHYTDTGYAIHPGPSTVAGARWVNNNIQVGDSPTDLSSGRWGVTFTALV